MAHVQTVKRSDGSVRAYSVKYRVHCSNPGHKHRYCQRSKAFDRKRDAEAFAKRVDTNRDDGKLVDPQRARMTLAEWVEVWRPSVVDLRASSLARLNATVDRHVLPAFGNRHLRDINNADVRAWVADLRAANVSTSSLRKCAFALRRILAAAVSDGRLASNPADNVPLPAERSGKPRFLTVADVWTLADAMTNLTTRCHGPEATGARYRALIVVGAFGGLRFGELAALRRRHVDMLRGRVTVEETLTDLNGQLSFGPPKTPNSLRTVPLPRRALDELAAHLDAYTDAAPDALVFTNADGAPLRRAGFRRSWWTPAVTASGLDDLTFHDLRHTYVSLAVAAGANPKKVSVRAGHSSVAFTLDRYGHLYEDDDDRETAAMDALIGRTEVAPPTAVTPLRPAESVAMANHRTRNAQPREEGWAAR